MSLILKDLHITIDVNNCDTIGKSQLKFVKLCTRTHEFQC